MIALKTDSVGKQDEVWASGKAHYGKKKSVIAVVCMVCRD